MSNRRPYPGPGLFPPDIDGRFYRPDAAPLRHLKDEPLEKRWPKLSRMVPAFAGLFAREITSTEEHRSGFPQLTQIWNQTSHTSERTLQYDTGILQAVEKEMAMQVARAIEQTFFSSQIPRQISSPGEWVTFTAGLVFYLGKELGLVWPHDFVLLYWKGRGYNFHTYTDPREDGSTNILRLDIGLGIR